MKFIRMPVIKNKSMQITNAKFGFLLFVFVFKLYQNECAKHNLALSAPQQAL